MMQSVDVSGLEECIAQAIQEHLTKANVEWPQLAGLDRPILRVEAFLEDAGTHSNAFRSKRIASVC